MTEEIRLKQQIEKPVIFIDGVCNLCNWLVRFTVRHERSSYFSFANLQSNFANNVLLYGRAGYSFSSVIVVDQGEIFVKSRAVFRIARHLTAPWSWGGVFRYLPLWLNDRIYDLMAANRYAIFGKKDQCPVPTAELAARFIS